HGDRFLMFGKVKQLESYWCAMFHRKRRIASGHGIPWQVNGTEPLLKRWILVHNTANPSPIDKKDSLWFENTSDFGEKEGLIQPVECFTEGEQVDTGIGHR